jgi:SAM-dependent methyltransferase
VSVVLCQQGFQFFPDKPVAMREMHRVLARSGRLALSVWKDTGVYNGAVGEALARLVGDDTAARFCASRNVPGRETLERFAAAAGFAEVSVRVSRMHIHLPRLDRFVLDHLAGTPVAAALAAADDAARRNIGASVTHALQSYADGDGVTYPEEIHVLTALAKN